MKGYRMLFFNILGGFIKYFYPIGILHIMFGVVLISGYYIVDGFNRMASFTTTLELGIGSLIIGASISIGVLIFAGLALHLMKYFTYTDQVDRAVNKE
nr:MAG TPA: hypothetical protein [Caudoviricetes sp.]